MGLVLGIPAAIVNLVQQGLLERAFHDGLFPALLYRAEALREEWPAHSGTEMFMSRPGLLVPITEPTPAGQDPVPQAESYEQWAARLDLYSGTTDIHMPTHAVSNANLFLRKIHTLGLQAGQSLNRIPRNEMFKAYLSGQTLSTASAAAGDVLVQVASLNGFTDVIRIGTDVRPVPVSPSSPLAVTIQGIGVRNVIGFTPSNPADPFGPGVLVLSAALGGAGIAARTPVISSAAPRVIRAGGGNSVDAIGASDIITLQDIINTAGILRTNNVQPHDDGLFHAHISSSANTQMFADPVFQRLHQSLPDHDTYKSGFLGVISGVGFYLNNESPDTLNSGTRTATGASAFYSKGIGAETTNEGAIPVSRTLVTGKGVMYEKYLDESAYVSEAGITGRVGEFDIVNNGMNVMTELVRLTLRAPMDRLQNQVAASWSITTSFPVPSDITAGGPERYKRAAIIEHAG